MYNCRLPNLKGVEGTMFSSPWFLLSVTPTSHYIHPIKAFGWLGLLTNLLNLYLTEVMTYFLSVTLVSRFSFLNVTS